ncbi:MAG: hypothetical protein SFU53_03485 [Terrimicrobiaceae bacterium]|nr:hypothetical protein [Terrimicrobiaceae bacterium]
MSAPLIFTHYGYADYLGRALRVAKSSNPGMRIFLLGDSANRRCAGSHAIHVPFESLAGGAKELEFQRVFRAISGERHRFNKLHGVDTWLRFVFRRWFLIEAFLEREGIEAFWTFDSDTLVLQDLRSRESRFEGYEATTQCKDQCLNGWVGSRALVRGYTQSILDQFSDPEYLELQRERLRVEVGLAFNEMDAFAEFRRREDLKTWHAQRPSNGEIFDDALGIPRGFEPAGERVMGRTLVKRLWTDGRDLFVKRNCGTMLRLVTCNMSWMPDFFWKRLERIVLNGRPGGAMKAVSYAEPRFHRIVRLLREGMWRVRLAGGRLC